MTTQARIEVGDKVSFHAGRKGRLTGIVTGSRIKESRGRRRELAEMFGGSTSREVFMIKVNETIWTCSPSNLTIVEKNAVASREASRDGHETLTRIKRHNSNARANRRSENFSKVSEVGLFDLSVGDAVEVSLHDRYKVSRWYPAKFIGFVPSSGRVRVEFEGRKITTPPQFVRIPESK